MKEKYIDLADILLISVLIICSLLYQVNWKEVVYSKEDQRSDCYNELLGTATDWEMIRAICDY